MLLSSPISSVWMESLVKNSKYLKLNLQKGSLLNLRLYRVKTRPTLLLIEIMRVGFKSNKVAQRNHVQQKLTSNRIRFRQTCQLLRHIIT